MKEVLKKICEFYFEQLKHNELGNYITTSPVSRHNIKSEKYTRFLSSISKAMLDDIIIKDFRDIKKHSITNNFLWDYFDGILGQNSEFVDQYFDIDFYVIPQVKTFYFFIEDNFPYLRDLNQTGESLSIFDAISNYPDKFLHAFYFNSNSELSEQEFCDLYKDYNFVNFNLDIPKALYTNNSQTYNISKLYDNNKPVSNFSDLLKMLYGDNKKVYNYNKIIEAYVIKAIELLCKNQTNLIYENQNEFYLGLWRMVYRNFLELIKKTNIVGNQLTTINFNDEEVKKIEFSILQIQHIDEITKLLYTFIHTKKLFDEYIQKNNDEYFDLTFITVSLFKTVEIIFNELLNNKWPHLYIKTKDKKINFSDNYLTLGNMYQIFKNDKNIFIPDEIVQYLNNKGRRNELQQLLSRWINKTRNGFLHKDLIEINNNMIDSSIIDSIYIICLLMLVFNWYK